MIELDGSIHDNEEVKINDEVRQKLIEEDGLTVMRFKNNEIINNLENVIKLIHAKF